MGAGQFIDSRVTLNLGLCDQSYSQKQPVFVSPLARKGYGVLWVGVLPAYLAHQSR